VTVGVWNRVHWPRYGQCTRCAKPTSNHRIICAGEVDTMDRPGTEGASEEGPWVTPWGNLRSLRQSCDRQYTTYAIMVTPKMTETRETRPLPGTSVRWQCTRAISVRTRPTARMSQPTLLSSEPVRPMDARITMVYLNHLLAGYRARANRYRGLNRFSGGDQQ
jgi:hypothetical protein